jgi:hypothetical protein
MAFNEVFSLAALRSLAANARNLDAVASRLQAAEVKQPRRKSLGEAACRKLIAGSPRLLDGHL